MPDSGLSLESFDDLGSAETNRYWSDHDYIVVNQEHLERQIRLLGVRLVEPGPDS